MGNNRKPGAQRIQDLLLGWLGKQPQLPPSNKMSPEMEIAYLKSKVQQAEREKLNLQVQFDKLKTHCDEISNRILDLERDQRESIDGEYLKLNTLTAKDKIVCITTKHKSLLDYKITAQISHTLRTKCPWLDLIFMIHEDVSLKSLTDEDLEKMGMKRLPKPKEDEEDGVAI